MFNIAKRPSALFPNVPSVEITAEMLDPLTDSDDEIVRILYTFPCIGGHETHAYVSPYKTYQEVIANCFHCSEYYALRQFEDLFTLGAAICTD